MPSRKPRGVPFKKGEDDRRAHGGAREGAGRKPNWFKQRCREIIEESDGLQFMGDVLSGKDRKPFVTMSGEKGFGPCSPFERMAAMEKLKEWGYGKTPLPLRATDEEGKPQGLIILPAQNMGRAGVVVNGEYTEEDEGADEDSSRDDWETGKGYGRRSRRKSRKR